MINSAGVTTTIKLLNKRLKMTTMMMMNISNRNLNLTRTMNRSIRKCPSEYNKSTPYKGKITRYREARRVWTEDRHSFPKMGSFK